MNFKQYLTENTNKLNIATTSLKKAREYVESELKKEGRDLDKEIKDFDKNYIGLQNRTKKALDIPRIEMPVIRSFNMKDFVRDLNTGHIDIFEPWVNGKDFFPKNLKDNKEGKDFLTLGIKDGNKTDDIIKATKKKVSSKNLLPTQSEIWLEALTGELLKHGAVDSNSKITTSEIIISKEGYILDGHHRYGQVMLSDPKIKMSTIFVPLGIKTLLKMGRSYGNAVGNTQQQ